MTWFNEHASPGLQRLSENLRTWEDAAARGVEVLAPSRRIAAYIAAVVSCAGLGYVAFALGMLDQRTALEREQRTLTRELEELRLERTSAEDIAQQNAEIEATIDELYATLFEGTVRFDVASAVTLIDDLARQHAVIVDRIAVRESSGVGLSIEARGRFVALATWVRGLAESELLITYQEFRLSRPTVAVRPEDRGMLMLAAIVTVHLPGEEA